MKRFLSCLTALALAAALMVPMATAASICPTLFMLNAAWPPRPIRMYQRAALWPLRCRKLPATA